MQPRLPFTWGARTEYPISSVAFGPSKFSDVVAVSTCANFGFYPSGRVGGYIVLCSKFGRARSLPTLAAPLGIAWHSESSLLACFSDGDVAAYEIASRSVPLTSPTFPIESVRQSMRFQAHSEDVSSIAVSSIDSSSVASVSWDGSVLFSTLDCQWAATRRTVIQDRQKTKRELHDVCFARDSPVVVVVASANSGAYICDGRSASPTAELPHASECLSVDCGSVGSAPIVACGTADGTVSFWDLRWPRNPLAVAKPHSWGIRCVRVVSPLPTGRVSNDRVYLLSSSYDMTSVLTCCSLQMGSYRPELLHQTRHQEFVLACDVNATRTLTVSGGWDKRVLVHSLTGAAIPNRL